MGWSNPRLGADDGKLNIRFGYRAGQSDMYLRVAVAERFGEDVAILCEREMAENGVRDGDI